MTDEHGAWPGGVELVQIVRHEQAGREQIVVGSLPEADNECRLVGMGEVGRPFAFQ